VSLRLEIIPPRQPESRGDAVGVDAGIGQDLLVIMRSDGAVVRRVANPKALRSSIADVRRTTRALSRKQPGSRRWRRAKQKVARVHMRAAAIRADTIHKATSELAKTHRQIVIEDLYLKGFARGMRKHRRAWAGAAFGEFRRQLTYKCGWYRSWTCQVCGTRHDRDENAGINLARLPASQAEAQSVSKTAPVRRATVKRVKHPRRMAAATP
jgi:putative transposase